ncbi:MAG: OPT family oligopeptide transporter [Spirochaetaceae bacterium]|nr:MAG: OPT family oligopeptide transporter [Spirochaetaceae bacterium]
MAADSNSSPVGGEWKPEIPEKHPSVLEPAVLIPGIILGVLGIIIGAELITRVGITPNTSVIGAIVAIGVARIPVSILIRLKSVHRQNLLQTVISGATFGGANGLLLPIGIIWLFGRPDLVPVLFIGVLIGLIVDMSILYKVYDTPSFPGSGIWPPGVAAAETIIAGDVGGKRALTLVAGAVVGGTGSFFGIPMDIFGVCWIGNIWALTMFGVGLLIRGYGQTLLGVNLTEIYLPHGMMIGAGLVALVQITLVTLGKMRARAADQESFTRSGKDLKQGFGRGFGAYAVGALVLAVLAGLFTEMPLWQIVLFVVFAAVAAEMSEILVGLSAMHAGWFPAFATALIFLVLGMLIGFPPLALVLLVGYTASTGPAFADMGYDLKAGWILRGEGKYPEFEKQGRLQQYWAEILGFACAAVFILVFYRRYFEADLFAPVSRVYVATIQAGTSPEVLRWLLIWCIPGAVIQAIGGPSRQMGVLLSTGLLIFNPTAGWTAIVALTIRAILMRVYGEKLRKPMYVLAGGFIAGSAIVSFLTGTLGALRRS